jgi:hypothetical protein
MSSSSTRRAVAVATFAALSATRVAGAKGPTSKLIIYGDRLAGPIEIVDPATLALSNLFVANYLDAARGAAPEPRALPQYEVSFYLPDDQNSAWRRFLHDTRLRRAYVVRLAVDSAHHVAYVYLPGDGDLWAGWNHAVIVRPELEGHWSYASSVWAEHIAGLIAHARRAPAPACPTEAGALFAPSDSLYAATQELRATLEARGIHVFCAYHSTFDRTLDRPAAGILTDLGPMAVVFFHSDADIRDVTMRGYVANGQAVTLLHRDGAHPPTISMVDAEPQSFIVHGRWLVDTFNQHQLASAVREALGEPADRPSHIRGPNVTIQK